MQQEIQTKNQTEKDKKEKEQKTQFEKQLGQLLKITSPEVTQAILAQLDTKTETETKTTPNLHRTTTDNTTAKEQKIEKIFNVNAHKDTCINQIMTLAKQKM